MMPIRWSPFPASRHTDVYKRQAQYGGAQSLQYALWQDGEIVLTGEAGTFSRSENRLMTGDELYGIGSVSKIYTTCLLYTSPQCKSVRIVNYRER